MHSITFNILLINKSLEKAMIPWFHVIQILNIQYIKVQTKYQSKAEYTINPNTKQGKS